MKKGLQLDADELETLVHSVAETKDTFTERDVMDLARWIKKTRVENQVAELILEGRIYASINESGELIMVKAKP